MWTALRERPIYLDELRAALRAGRRLVAFNAMRGVYELELTAEAVDKEEEGAAWQSQTRGGGDQQLWALTLCRL